MSQQALSTTLPLRLGRYLLVEEVGVGGLGRVYRAQDTESNQVVAVKLLHDQFIRSKKILGIFHREVLIMSRLHHKHLLSYIESYFQPPSCYIVSEFVNGHSLKKIIRTVGKVPPIISICIIFDVLQGIDYLHLHDTIHSDLSSSNVLIDLTGRVLVADFGLSCSVGIEDYKNYMIGTPGYFSPEHVSTQAIVPQSDLYCVGLLLYEMLTGEKAVVASSHRDEVYRSMKQINFKNISTQSRTFDSYLRKFIKKSLHIKASKRIGSCEEMLSYCFEILRRCGIRYVKPAVLQYLTDCGISNMPFEGPRQDIYLQG